MDAPAIDAPRPFLSLDKVSKRFGGTTALEEIDWSVDAGALPRRRERVGEVDTDKIVSGVHVADLGGSITIERSRYSSLTLQIGQVSRRAGDLPGAVSLPESDRAREHNDRLRAPLTAPAPPRRAMRDATTAALARLNAHLPLDAKVGTLLVEQPQIVAICRRLAANARVLFMDEPTASLTRREVELLLETVRRLKALGVAVVSDPSQSFKWHQHDCPSNIARWNYHPECEIHLITRSHERQFAATISASSGPAISCLRPNPPHN
jgi:simple sugar transport system ATP-binding protein